MKISSWIRHLLLLSVLLLASCNLPASPQSSSPTPSEPTATPFQPVIGATSPDGVALEQGEVEGATAASWWLDPSLPEAFVNQLALPDGAQVVDDQAQANLILSVNQGDIVSQWVYALVAPFPTLTDEVSLADLRAAWGGENDTAFAGAPLLLNSATEAAFAAAWGQPAAGAVQVMDAGELLDAAWASDPAWAIIPFEELHPRWKVLVVDGQSPIHKDFDAGSYALTLHIGLGGDPTLVAEALQRFGPDSEAPLAPVNNRDADKLTTVVVTGVTALVRATAYDMDRYGILYPAEDVGPLLREADITHISNEVPFAQDCPRPDPVQRNLVFCSNPDYIQLMDDIGTDVVELTGDHFNDWSRDAMLYTLEIYKEHNVPYYGGGVDATEARQPLKLEDHGNKIAFVGCNGKGGGYASASDDYPGAVACDMDYMEQTVRDLAAEGYVVIVTFQHNEVYQFVPAESLVRDFTRVSQAGASIVSGSQAHQAHGMEFTGDDAIITYGLGNMFFDQKGVIDYGDQAMMARHVIYNGHYISTELFTIQFVDFAKPRYMTTEERDAFLPLVFKASDWDYPTTDN